METISSFMDKDHALIEKLWNGFVDSHEGEDSHKEHFDKFYKNFTRHLSLEENFLFPRLDKYLGMKGEPSITVLAKQDHEGLLKLINLMQKKC